MSRLAFAAGGGSLKDVSWFSLQQLLQQEETDCLPNNLTSLENSLIAVLGRHLDRLLQLGDREKELRQLELHYQTTVNPKP